MFTRRTTLMATAAASIAAMVTAFSLPAMAQDGPIQVGLIGPMSGPWARQGELMLKGAELAINDINEGGGISALGNRKLELVVFDAGESVETAKNAAQRMVSQHPDLVEVTGTWLSSFTLAMSEVTERVSQLADDRRKEIRVREEVLTQPNHQPRPPPRVRACRPS